MTPPGIEPETCSAVPQPTAPPRAPSCFLYRTDMATASLSMLVLSIIDEEQACETPQCPYVRVGPTALLKQITEF